MTNRYIFLTLVVSSLLLGCGRHAEQYERRPVKVHVDTIRTLTEVYTHTYVGEIEELTKIPISAETAGQVKRVSIRQGETVQAGQVLLEIDSTQAHNAYVATKATLAQAQDGYTRARQVHNQGGIADVKMVEIETKLQQAQSLMASAEKTLRNCQIIAPVGGVIGKCDVEVGQTISPGIPIVTLLNVEGYHVRFDVAENDIAQIAVGDTGWMVVEAIGQEKIPFVIAERNLVANRLAHTYTLRGIISDKALSNKLLPGMVSKVRLLSQSTQGVFVPTNCVQIQKDGTTVWVVNGNKAERRYIQTGQYTAGGILVTKGLVEGDVLITDGYQKLYSGAEIVYEL